MTLGRRFRIFFIGIAIGIVLAYAFFGDREFDWTPNDRVLLRLRSQPLVTNSKIDCQLNCLGITEADIKLLLDSGDVNFSGSEPRREPYPIYLIEGELKKAGQVGLKFEGEDTIATNLMEIVSPDLERCDC